MPRKTPNGNKLFIVASFLSIKKSPTNEPNTKEANATETTNGHPKSAPKNMAILPSPHPIHFPLEIKDMEKKKSEPIVAPNKLSGKEGITREKILLTPS